MQFRNQKDRAVQRALAWRGVGLLLIAAVIAVFTVAFARGYLDANFPALLQLLGLRTR